MSRQQSEPMRAQEPRWSRAYGFVLCFFALEIVLLYLFTIRFS